MFDTYIHIYIYTNTLIDYLPHFVALETVTPPAVLAQALKIQVADGIQHAVMHKQPLVSSHDNYRFVSTVRPSSKSCADEPRLPCIGNISDPAVIVLADQYARQEKGEVDHRALAASHAVAPCMGVLKCDGPLWHHGTIAPEGSPKE